MTEALVYIGFGFLVVAASWSPLFLERIPISLPMVVLAIGIGLSLPFSYEQPLVQHSWWVEHITSIALIVSVMGAGLRLDRTFPGEAWRGIWRLLAVTMPLSIVAIAAAAAWLLGLPLAYALLVGAVLAPTDPVLASAVQAGPPGSDDHSDARFNLTGEAGLNDGLAYPFVLLALALATNAGFGTADLGTWLVRDVVWALVAGIGSGVALGHALVWLNRRLPEERRLSATKSGFVALGLSFLAYGLAEQVAGNGYVAVFVLAVAIRNAVHRVEYPRQLDHFLSELERIVMVVVILLFGLAIGNGLLREVSLVTVLFAGIVLFVVRPVSVWIGVLGSGLAANTRGALAYFGIRGLGALFYLTYALDEHGTDVPTPVTTAVGLVVLVSIILYGASTEAVVRRLRLG